MVKQLKKHDNGKTIKKELDDSKTKKKTKKKDNSNNKKIMIIIETIT